MERLKKAVGYQAAEIVENHMVIGLGTGSTVLYFIKALSERVKKGLNISCVSSSIKSERLAIEGGIPIANLEKITLIDLMVDGADEITTRKEMIKGGGGALLREKVLATISNEMVVIVDESKVVSLLGKHPLPIEVLPFATQGVIKEIHQLGYQGTLRQTQSGALFVTDNGNYIFDIHFDTLRKNPQKDHEKLSNIPGILETGFFFNLAGRVMIGRANGVVEKWD